MDAESLRGFRVAAAGLLIGLEAKPFFCLVEDFVILVGGEIGARGCSLQKGLGQILGEDQLRRAEDTSR